MPSGYTSPVQEGRATFSSFVWHCVEAFFHDAHLPSDKENDEEIARLALRARDTQAALDADLARTPEEWATKMRQSNAQIRQWNDEVRQGRELTLSRYNAMLAEVRAWQPPTPDHEPLKKHMERQLLESIEFDCAPTLDYSESELPLDEYIADAILQSRRDAESARRNLEKTMELLKNRKAYLMELERSVPRPK